MGLWLRSTLSHSPAYESILSSLKAGGQYLDVGCFIGQDMRRLVYDGGPSDRLYGVDIVNFWDPIGFDMFRDRDKFRGKFIESSFLAEDNLELGALEGQVDVIFIAQVLHQWTRGDQVKAVERLCTFSKPGTILAGNQVGNIQAQEVAGPGGANVPLWRHDVKSWKDLWAEACKSTGMEWEVEAWLRSWEEMGWDPAIEKFMTAGDGFLEFVCTRKA